MRMLCTVSNIIDSSCRFHGDANRTVLLFQHDVELSFRVPRNYPPTAPSVCLRLPTLNGVQQRQMSIGLLNFIAKRLEDDSTTGILYDAINWVRDEVAVAESSDQPLSDGDVVARSSSSEQNAFEFSRLWIYSHHIYNRAKRRTILDHARELELTGFCAPGKPGVICVEGWRRHADDFWQYIRNLQWQRITLVHREDSTTDSSTCFEALRRFDGFDEQCFESQGGGNHGKHMDRGQLLQFLVEHNCSAVFHMYFGVGSKDLTASSDK